MAAVGEIGRLSADRSVFQVIQGVRTAMVLTAVRGDGDVGDPPAALLELVALVLVCRDAGRQRDSNLGQPDPEFNPDSVRAAALAAMDAGTMLPLFEAPPSDPFGQVLFLSTQREIMLRNPVYPHMLLDTLRGLFDDAAVGSDCRDILGFSGLEAVNVLEAARTLSIDALQERFDRLLAARDATMPMIMERRAASRPAAGADEDDGDSH